MQCETNIWDKRVPYGRFSDDTHYFSTDQKWLAWNESMLYIWRFWTTIYLSPCEHNCTRMHRDSIISPLLVYEQNTRLTTGDDTFSSCSFSYESLSLGTWAYEFWGQRPPTIGRDADWVCVLISPRMTREQLEIRSSKKGSLANSFAQYYCFRKTALSCTFEVRLRNCPIKLSYRHLRHPLE